MNEREVTMLAAMRVVRVLRSTKVKTKGLVAWAKRKRKRILKDLGVDFTPPSLGEVSRSSEQESPTTGGKSKRVSTKPRVTRRSSRGQKPSKAASPRSKRKHK